MVAKQHLTPAVVKKNNDIKKIRSNCNLRTIWELSDYCLEIKVYSKYFFFGFYILFAYFSILCIRT